MGLISVCSGGTKFGELLNLDMVHHVEILVPTIIKLFQTMKT